MRPNILFIMTDQQFSGAMSCAGNTDLQTPAIDSLAKSGVQFDQAYCAYPVCIPSRLSLLAGRMPFDLGYRQWGDGIDPKYERQQLGYLFADAGYDCAYGGKVHAPTNDATAHGFRSICGQTDNQLAQACVDFLGGPHSNPFLLVASFDNPHNICEWARHQDLPWGNIPDAPIADCPSLPVNYAIPPYEPQIIRTLQSRFPTVYAMTEAGPDEWRQYRNAYYRLIEKVDTEIGKILNALNETGLRDNTLIVFTSDHGDGHGAHRCNQKSFLYEESVRIPLIVSHPNITGTGKRDSRHLISNGLDILPTLCDYTGVDAPPDLPGRSLRPLVDGHPPTEWRDELVVEAWPFQGDPGRTLGRMVRTQHYKYAVYSWGRYREQLFDVQTDPGEMVNLAVQSSHRDILQDHRDRLRHYCERSGDEFLPHVPTNC